jgi:hypothetical protein
VWRKFKLLKNFPRGLKPTLYSYAFCGTAEAVPFQNLTSTMGCYVRAKARTLQLASVSVKQTAGKILDLGRIGENVLPGLKPALILLALCEG